jgi:predicted AAA+ superfamily ATPase
MQKISAKSIVHYTFSRYFILTNSILADIIQEKGENLMTYIRRALEKTFLRWTKQFPAVLVTGPRQIGKTTMLKKLVEEEGLNRQYITLDDLEERRLAKEDPQMFLQLHKPPLFIDEVQYAPELFVYIKIYVDEHEKMGDFWLTGSQVFKLMDNVQESLAGRIGILQMSPLSQEELACAKTEPFVLDTTKLAERIRLRQPQDALGIYGSIFKGGMPAIASGRVVERDALYGSYLSTYIDRDVKEISGSIDALKFSRFITAVAALGGQMVNYKTIADHAEINVATVKNWLGILERLGIIFYLHPYSNNMLKRLVTTPKLYFADTGLMAYLTDWSSRDTLFKGAMSGAALENFTISEIRKSYLNNGLNPKLYYYRDKDMREIDLLLEQDGVLYPMEIKKTALPDKRLTNVFKVIERTSLQRGIGAVLCLTDKLSAFDKDNLIVPIWGI